MSDTAGRPRYRWRPWKVLAVAFAALLLAGGGVLALSGGGPAEPEPRTEAPPSSAPEGFTPPSFGPTTSPGGVVPEAPAEPADEEDGGIAWSPVLLRGGISFFAAFALAFAFRTFLRLALLFAGIWVASLLLLSSLGWIEVHWSVIDDQFVGWTRTLGEQFKSVTAFVAGSLPSAGLAGLGLLAGFRKG
jgi:uncharacterized membrane protein (Fun14 family)